MASSRASSSRTLSLALVLAAAAALLLARPGAAQSPPAPAPSGGSCMTEIVSLYPCLGYMSGNNSASKPSASCCSALSSVVTSNPRCLCVVLGGGASSLGVTINNTRAFQLPADCAVKTPPASECKSVGVPVTPSSPATPSAPSTSPQTPSVPSVTPPAAAGTGTKATQQTAESSAAGGGKATSVLPVAVAVLSAALALLHA